MRLAVPKESTPGETRVAIVPDTIKRLVAKSRRQHRIRGRRAIVRARRRLRAAGAKVQPSADALFAEADVVVQIHPPTAAQIAKLREGSALISLLYPLGSPTSCVPLPHAA